MKWTKKIKYGLIGGLAATAAIITIPVCATACSFSQSTVMNIAPSRDIPKNITAESLVKTFAGKPLIIQSNIMPFTKSLSTDKSCLNENVAMFFNKYLCDHQKTNHLNWNNQYLTNVTFSFIRVPHKQEFKATVTLTAGKDLKTITVAKTPLYITWSSN